MSLNLVTAGRDLANDVNVVIEIPMHADPIKYEVDKAHRRPLRGPVRLHGHALSLQLRLHPPDPLGGWQSVDVLVITPFALMPGVVVRCRPIGVLKMTDEAGDDMKLLAVPIDKLTPLYRSIERPPATWHEVTLSQIEHFFAHYKDLEPGKWVKVEGWKDADAAKREIVLSVERYGKADPKPVY